MRKVFLVMAIATLFAAGVYAAASNDRGGGDMIVAADGLNVRSGPSSDSGVVGQLAKGTRVQVLNSSGQWYRIRSGSIEGYVNSDYLTTDSGYVKVASQNEPPQGAKRETFEILMFPPPIEGGDFLLDVGVGLMSVTYSSAEWKIPPLFVIAEYALPAGVPISVGAMFSIYQYGYDFWGLYSWTWTDFVIAARGNWHWGFNVEWLDFYTGISLGYRISTSKTSDSFWKPSTNYSGFYYGFHAGAHFYFSKTFGVVVETGYPYWIKAGVALKF